jgi:hypothetical protein
MTADIATHGWTPNELAKLLRVSPDKVRSWIKRGVLSAIDTNDVQCGRPRYVILPHHLADFERRRHAATPEPPKRKRRKQTMEIDFYPD